MRLNLSIMAAVDIGYYGQTVVKLFFVILTDSISNSDMLMQRQNNGEWSFLFSVWSFI